VVKKYEKIQLKNIIYQSGVETGNAFPDFD
jgi:hypothetical protein